MYGRYFDSNGDEVAEHDALDRNGVLRDGCMMRVPVTLRDSTARRAYFVDGGGNPLDLTAGNKPGFRIRPNDARRKLVEDSYQAYEQTLTTAWRGTCDDEAECDLSGDCPMWDAGGGTRAQLNGDVHAARDQAYREYDQQLGCEWKNGGYNDRANP